MQDTPRPRPLKEVTGFAVAGHFMHKADGHELYYICGLIEPASNTVVTLGTPITCKDCQRLIDSIK